MQTRSRTRGAAICVLAVLLTASQACRKTPGAGEYEVLSAFIDGQFASRKGMEPTEPTGEGITKIVILKTTQSDENAFYVRRDGNGQTLPWAQTARSLQTEAPTLKQTTIDAFREANRHQAPLQRSFHTSFDYELVELSQLEPVFKNGSWPAFYKRYPGSPGIIAFSRVGFDATGTQALFYVSCHCGGLCGGGAYVVMERHDAQWAIQKVIETTTS